jgi:hypothetical protein
MTVISGVTGSGKHTSLKQLLDSLPKTTGEAKDTDPIEYSIRGMYMPQIQRADTNPKGGILGARKYRQALKTLKRGGLGEVMKGEPMPTPSLQLTKNQRQNRLGYAPVPRQRSSTARGRKAALMVVLGMRSGTRRILEAAAVSGRKSQS